MPKTNTLPSPAADPVADRTLDITNQVCPMTFVRTRLALDCMASGEILLVLLRGDEPRKNVPATATAQGHSVLDQQDTADGVTKLWLRRA
jgi:tRNA 2-thiouridine synthesizing protein A